MKSNSIHQTINNRCIIIRYFNGYRQSRCRVILMRNIEINYVDTHLVDNSRDARQKSRYIMKYERKRNHLPLPTNMPISRQYTCWVNPTQCSTFTMMHHAFSPSTKDCNNVIRENRATALSNLVRNMFFPSYHYGNRFI